MKILCDVDMVLADTFGSVQEILKHHNLPPMSKADQWDWFNDFTPKQKKVVDPYLKDWKFWADLFLIPGAQLGVDYLRYCNHEVLFLTSPYTPCIGWEHARRLWLAKYFNASAEDIIFADKKYKVTGDVIIDDKQKHVFQWQKANPDKQALLFEAPYNRGHSTTNWYKIIGGHVL